MSAELTGKHFQIDSLSSTVQGIPDSSFRQWDWDVTPTTSGNLTLHLHVSIVLRLPGMSDTPVDLVVADDPVSVTVDRGYEASSFATSNWQWIITTLLGSGVIGWLTRRRWWPGRAAKPAGVAPESVAVEAPASVARSSVTAAATGASAAAESSKDAAPPSTRSGSEPARVGESPVMPTVPEATPSFVFGIVGIVFTVPNIAMPVGLISGIVAVVLGCLAIATARRHPGQFSGEGRGWAGVAMGSVALGLSLLTIVLALGT